MILFLFFVNPTFGQISLSPELEVHDPTGLYSGQTPLVKTVSLLELEECTDVQKIYHEPTQRKDQVLKG